MRIAVVGCGIAGTTSACMLARANHDVTLFEQAPKVGPVGAGFLLQPAGQQVLNRLGLLESATANAARIDGLVAQHRSGRPLVELNYRTLDEKLFAFGVHRGDVFSTLLKACHDAGVHLTEGCAISGMTESGSQVELKAREVSAGSFDLVIAADGARSTLRTDCGLARRVHQYNYAALWMVGPFSGNANRLRQIVEKTTSLVGVLPIGQDRCSFFWGLHRDDLKSLRADGIDAWKQKVGEFVPDAYEIVAGVESFDDLTFAMYHDVRMKQLARGRIAFVGDAAHATSPHLGQGVNLALGDAESLANAIIEEPCQTTAFARYQKERRGITQFYSQLTGLLTPFFQSDSRLRGFGRDIALPIMPKLPYVGKQMVKAMAGLKRGWLS